MCDRAGRGLHLLCPWQKALGHTGENASFASAQTPTVCHPQRAPVVPKGRVGQGKGVF